MAPAPGQAPQQGAAPQPQGGQPATPPNPQQVQQNAELVASALLDPNVAMQNGFTAEDMNYARQIVDNPQQAIQQGEDPNLVNALASAYQRISQGGTMQNASAATANVAGSPTPSMDQTAQGADNLDQSGAMNEAETVRSVSTLIDLIPKVKSSKLFYKYVNNFKEMLSILGELIFSMEIQAAKYKNLLGDAAYDDTIYMLQQLYEQFGDVVLKLYQIEK
jgi:hypothetical protein